jgi:capsular exopolysaccharide synthesis family protein
MNPSEYLRAIRRRWLDVVLAVAVALAAGLFITRVAPSGPPVSSYQATAFLISSTNLYTTGSPNLGALAALTTVGDVPVRVAERLDFPDEPLLLAEQIRAVANTETGILQITATSSDREYAAVLANAFAEELVGFLGDRNAESISTQGRSLTERLDQLEGNIEALDGRIAAASPSRAELLRAERDALVRQYGLVYEAYQQLAASAADPGALQIVQGAYPEEVPVPGFQPPRSTFSRLVLAGFLGLVAGVGIVLVLDRFDSRIRTRKAAEKHFGFPVLTEIPFVPRRTRKDLVVAAAARPKSHTADAYRILAAMISTGRGSDGKGVVSGNGGGKPPKTILVTSPGPADGKTTVVANLAATFAGVGKRVLILSCDFRRPRIHRMFGVPNDVGLAEALVLGDGSAVLDGHVHGTALPKVAVVPSGSPPEQPGELLGSARMEAAIREAGQYADIVLIDTAPILTTSDATSLLAHVEAVVVVARAGRTTSDVAERTSQILQRLGAPVAGVALNAVSEATVPRPYYYHYYGYYREPAETGRKGFPRLARLLTRR